MTQEGTKSFASEVQPSAEVDPRIIEAINEGAMEGKFSCFMAEDTVKRLRVTWEQTKDALKLSGLHIYRCQMGLFGYSPESGILVPKSEDKLNTVNGKSAFGADPNMTPLVEAAIRSSLVNGCLSCRAAWTIADKFNLTRRDMALFCVPMKI